MDIKAIKEHLVILSQACDMIWGINRSKRGGYVIQVMIKKQNNKWYSTAFHSYDIIDKHDINHALGQASIEMEKDEKLKVNNDLMELSKILNTLKEYIDEIQEDLNAANMDFVEAERTLHKLENIIKRR